MQSFHKTTKERKEADKKNETILCIISMVGYFIMKKKVYIEISEHQAREQTGHF